MILYNITINIPTSIQKEWLNWMQTVHIPNVMATGFFRSYTLFELIQPEPEPDTATYTIQYQCDSLDDLADYRANFAPALQQEHNMRYANQFVAFRTILKKIK